MTQIEKTDSVINKANMYYGETVSFPLDHNADRRDVARSRFKRSDLRANTIADHAMEMASRLDEIAMLIPTFGLSESAEKCLRAIVEPKP